MFYFIYFINFFTFLINFKMNIFIFYVYFAPDKSLKCVLHSPYGRSSDDPDEQDPAPAESVACWEDEDVLQEERVQLRQLESETEPKKPINQN